MSMFITALLLVAMLAVVGPVCLADNSTAGPASFRVYLGTASRHGSKGIYLAQLDTRSGSLSEPRLVAEVDGPTFLAVHPDGTWMYSVGQRVQDDGTRVGTVHAFAVDRATGDLTALNHQPSGGTGPCHLTVDPQGRHVLVANYASGSVAVLPIESDGRLGAPSPVIQHAGRGADPRRQAGPHAHAIQVHRTAPFAFAADLGTDRLLAYRYDSEGGTLELDEPASLATEPGAGPRHFAFHPSLDTVYLINELDSTVVTARFDPAESRLVPLQRLTTLPDDFDGTNYPSEVAVHPTGRFLYGANRGHDSLAVFHIDTTTGQLEPAGQVAIEGQAPRHFAIDPTGQFLIAAHEQSNNIAIFRLDPETGQPRFTGQHVSLGTPMAVLYQPQP